MFRHILLLILAGLVLFACDNTSESQQQVPTPTFNPQPGTYFTPQNVQINVSYAQISIRYTLDGTDPTENSTVYTAPIPVTAQATIKARGYRSKMKPSNVATGNYTFRVGTMYLNPTGGTFTTPQTVTIIPATAGTVIHYTTDGAEPTDASPTYTAPLLIDRNTVLKAKGFIAGWTPGETVSGNFSFNTAAPTMNYPAGTYYNPLNLTMNSATEGASVFYTTDGSEPTEASSIYSEAVSINSSATFKIKAFKAGWNPSATVTADYTLKAVAPTYNPGPGTFYESQYVSISTTTADAEIRYTTNGSEPTTSSALYSEPVQISGTQTLKARAFKDGWSGSNVSTGTYTIKVNAPAFNPPQGSYGTPQLITLSCVTPGAEIRYTLNAGTPGPTSLLYSAPFMISSNTTIQAIAYKEGLTPSAISTGYYTIINTVSPPEFNPDPSVVYTEPLEVTLSCDTPGASIYYTLDHTPPSIISTMYTIYPIQITQTTEIRAIAYKDNMNPSPIVIAFYTVERTVATPTFSPDPSVLYYSPQSVTLECTTPGATIRYTTDGSEPTESSNEYSDPIYITSSALIKAKGFRDSWTPSPTASAQYQIESNNQIFAWGLNDEGQCNVPIGMGFLQIDAGAAHTVALRSNGSLAAWGNNSNQQCNFPLGNNYVAVSAGGNHSLALKADGTVVAWGNNEDGQCTVPPPTGYTYQAISAGGNFSLALTSLNTIVAWGNNDDGQCTVPTDSDFIKVSAGNAHALALRSNNTLVAWGNNDNGQLNAPADNGYSDIAAGYQHCLAKRTNGSLVAWGDNSSGQATSPGGSNYSIFSAGKRHNVALRTDGSIFTWGYDGQGLATVPSGTGYIDISAGEDFSVALISAARLKKNVRPSHIKPKGK